jgi:ABC-type lipoprotein release transport system permease subunit
MDPSLKLAMGEFRDHKGVYIAIILIVALSMTIFTTQSAMNEYNDYTTMRSVGMFYGDGVITAGGSTVRTIISGASRMDGVSEVMDKINAIEGFSATPRVELEGATWYSINGINYDDAITAWGVDISTDENVCRVKDKIIEGKYFDASKNYTQMGMGNPLGATALHSPTLSGGPFNSSQTRNNYTIKPYPIIVGKTAANIRNGRIGTIFEGSALTEAALIYCDVRYEIISIYETDKPFIEGIFYVIPIESAREIKGWGANSANYICVRIPEGMSDSDARSVLQPIIGDKVFYSRTDIKNAIEGNLNNIGRTILNITIGASLVLAAAAVKFVMDSIIIRKSREIGTLKALGARDSVVVRIFIYQAVFIGVLAGGLGLLIATAVMNALSAYGFTIAYSLNAQMKIQFILTPMTAATSFALPVAVSLAAAVLPCKKVAALSPVEAIRHGELQSSGHSSENSTSFKFIFPNFKSSLKPFSLAIDEMKDHAAIYAVVVLVISSALAVFALQAGYQENLKQSVTLTLKDTICADGMVLSKGATPRSMMGGGALIQDAKSLAEKISAETGYTAIIRSNKQSVIVLGTTENPVYEGGSVWGIDTKNDEIVFQLEKNIVDGTYFNRSMDYSQDIVGSQFQVIPGLRAGGLSSTTINEAGQKAYPIIIGSTCAKGHDLKVGSKFSMLMAASSKGAGYGDYTFGTGIVSAPFEVVGIYDSSFALADALMYFTPIEAVNQMMGYDAGDGNAIIIKAPKGVDYREIHEALSMAAPDYEAFSWHEAVIYLTGPAFDALLLIIYTAITITLILAAVIIKYAMDSAVDRKTREIGTLKAFGARDRTIIEIFMYQGVFIGILSGIMAMGLATALSYLAINVIKLQTQLPMGMIMQVGFTITWTILLITVLTPLVTSLIAASIPSKRAAELSPVEALRKGELNL